MTGETSSHEILVDEIFAGLVAERGLPTAPLAKAFRRGRFVSAHYPSGGTLGAVARNVPPDFAQFKGKLGANNQVWFERLYLELGNAKRIHLETKPSGAWIHVNRLIGQDEAERIIGSPIGRIIDRRPLPETITIIGVTDTSIGSYGQSRLEITPPRRIKLPIVAEQTDDASTDRTTSASATRGLILDESGMVHKDLASYLARTHRKVPAWNAAGREWTRDGIRIPDGEVAHIDIVLHKTPGILETIPAISITAPYDRDRAYGIGRQDGTFFDRKRSAWMIPLSVPAYTAGKILMIWQVLALPDGTFLQAKLE